MKLFRSGEVIIPTLRVGRKSGGCKRKGNSDLTYRSIHLPVVEAVNTSFKYESPNPPIEGSKQSRIKTIQCHNGTRWEDSKHWRQPTRFVTEADSKSAEEGRDI